ncbi:TetR/AcrR family transcriptional regulator [Rhodococcus erythropolis]|uniref:TetR family transcriptional regulator n=1 Tax=Rhodococcus erythropolis TaxID=1833 RepID=A0A0C3AAP9_RHOER|nr:TetR/AcrR family transcriptional regulator [Rhodococcus erythropolis]KAB2587089.1 TetR family transcriptional regulator [Rhodococcus erythropolis]KIM17134.1 TetR family transcriptional regulator [Rhodococcus erythropolis]MBS2990585.1 TetR/AcrR family transcriptional regulator [Rhodococcus erythropolis]MDJ0401972.1 TetR/AcrR family transcriptional regulator [Rhodococcus erythropolis]
MTVSSLRETLVATGVEILDADGATELTLREIARRAGVSHGAPRRYFPTHNSLLAAIASHGLRDLTDRLQPALVGKQPARSRLISAAIEYVSFAQERPAMFELMFRHDLLEGAGSNLRESSLPLFAALQALTEEADASDPTTSAVNIWTGTHGIAVLAANRSLALVAPGLDIAALVTTSVTDHLLRTR